MNWNPRYSSLWRFIGAHGVAILTGGLAYVANNPTVLTDRNAQQAAVGVALTTAVSWLLGANLPKAPVQ